MGFDDAEPISRASSGVHPCGRGCRLLQARLTRSNCLRRPPGRLSTIR